MATRLENPIHRDCEIQSSWFRSHRVIVTLHPGGFIGFREKGRRTQYKLPLTEAARQAVVNSTNKIRAREKELRLAGKRRGAKAYATREVLRNIAE